MLRYRLIFALIISFCISGSIQGQDIHYSQFFNSPLNLSPSMAGYFNGDTRIHANYRNQWENVPVDYVSADVGVDFKLRNVKNANYIAVGGLINYDQAGDLNLSMTGVNVFLAYSFELSKSSRISPAITGSFAQRRFDSSLVTSGNQWDGRAYNPSIPAEDIGSDNKSYIDLGAGLNYRWQTAYRKHVDLGFSAYHLINAKESF